MLSGGGAAYPLGVPTSLVEQGDFSLKQKPLASGK